MTIVDNIVADLVKRLEVRNAELSQEGLARLPHYSIRVLGQMSLLMDSEAVKLLPLAITLDLDATLIAPRATNELKTILTEVLRDHNLVYDELSPEIWVPPEAEFLTYYEDYLLRVERLDPISALTAKAVKAPAKNRELVRAALKVYGKKLKDNIILHGGNVEMFIAQAKTTL